MRRILLAIFLLSTLTGTLSAQEIDLMTEVTMDALTPSQKTYLAKFEEKVKDYVNMHRWTDVEFYGDQIPVRMSINFLSGTDAGEFTAQVVVDGQRRLWKDGRPLQMTSLMFRIMDSKWAFSYQQGQPFVHDEYQYNDITSLLDFYMYIALGLDFDSYEPLAGSPYYQKALTIAQRSQSSRNAGEWQGQSNQYSRMNFLNELLNAQYERFREALYWYYYEGLDFLETEPEFARRAIAKALEKIGDLLSRTGSRSLVLTMWLEAKANEFCAKLEGYPDRAKVMKLMMQVDPARQQIYQKCSF